MITAMVEELSGFASSLSAIATVLIAVYTWRLYVATRELSLLSEGQQNTTKLIQRARIWVEIGNVRALKDERGFVPRVIIRNTGHMPASNVAWVFGEPEFTTDNDWQPPSDPINLKGAITLAPGAEMTHGGAPLHMPNDPPTYLYVWGLVSYNDGFADGRLTQFCHRYNMKLMWLHLEATGSRVFPKKACRYNRYYNNAT